jgi:peptidoglycan/LPS O-acetylase OafA/YrhL
VALYHFLPYDSFQSQHRPAGAMSGFVGAGYVGVSFFFMLSGFILTYSHAREYELGRESKARFYFARFARIYPIYLVSMIVAALLYPGTFTVLRHALVFMVDLLMLQSWSVRTVLFFNIPSWTLSCEMFFYAVFPFLLLRIRPRSRKAAICGVGALWILALLPAVLSLHHEFGWNWTLWGPEQPGTSGLMIRRNPLFALPEFVAGMLIGWMRLEYPPRARTASWLVVVGTVGAIVPLLFAQRLSDSLLHNGLLIPAFGALILGLAIDTPISRALSVSPLVLLGEASYAFYLMHYMFNRWVIGRFGAGQTAMDAIWKIAVMIVVSIALYLGIERPARRYLLQWWNSRRRSPRSVRVH